MSTRYQEAYLLDKPMPSNLEAERLILGVILLDNKVLRQATEQLKPEDFFLPSHRQIYNAMLRLAENNAGIDPLTLQDALRIAGQFEQIGGAAYIASLFDGVPRFSNIRDYCALVKRASAMRQFITGAQLIMSMGFDNEDNPENVRAKVKSLLLGIDGIGGVKRSLWASELLEGALNRQTNQHVLPTGITELDKLLRGGGLLPGDFFVIAARTSKGKSTLAMQISALVCDRYDTPEWQAKGRAPVVLYVSLESDNEDVVDRIIGIKAQLSFDSLQKGAFLQDENQRRIHWLNRIGNWRLACCDVPRMGIEEVVREAEIIQSQEGALDLVVIDYLGLLNSQNKSKERIAFLEALTREIKLAAADLKCPMIVPVQINREGVKEGRKYRLDDLRGCGSIEQDATKVLLLQDPEAGQAEAGYTIEAWLAKQRKGVVGMFNLFFDSSYGAFGQVEGSCRRGLPAEEPRQPKRQRSNGQSAPKPQKSVLEQFDEQYGLTGDEDNEPQVEPITEGQMPF